MRQTLHTLPSATPGSQHTLASLHYGTPGAGPKVYIQASLHADEVPGMLVAHHLRGRLAELEAQGCFTGEVVLVPAANPIGLAQRVLHGHQGRFDLASGENFNRQFTDLTEKVATRVEGRLGSDAAANVALVRVALGEAIAEMPGTTPLQALRRLLMGLAADADVVLDLHCDGQAVLHFYTTPATWPQAGELLARCLGAEAVLLAERSGGDPFDEACSMLWPDLARRLGPAHPLPPACLAATIELRGEADVTHPLARRDAEAIVLYLHARGVIHLPAAPELPPLRCEATPLAGSIPIDAPHGGVLVFHREPGEWVKRGDLIADLIDPIQGEVTPLTSPVDGHFFARDLRRFATAGMPIGKVAGRQALRQGSLLSA